MAPVKGFCVLNSHSDDANAPVNKLTIGKKYGFEKEKINDAIGFGYTIIDGVTQVKLKQSSFELYFSEVAASTEQNKVVEKSNAVIKGPTEEKGNAAIKPGVGVIFDLSGWESVCDIIEKLTLTPSATQPKRIDLLITIKPGIDVTMFGTAQEIMMNVLPQIKEFVSVKAKVADLQVLIEQKISLEKEAVKIAEKKVADAKKPDVKKEDAAKTTTKTTVNKGKAVDTTPKNELFNQNESNPDEPEETTEATETDQTEENWG